MTCGVSQHRHGAKSLKSRGPSLQREASVWVLCVSRQSRPENISRAIYAASYVAFPAGSGAKDSRIFTAARQDLSSWLVTDHLHLVVGELSMSWVSCFQSVRGPKVFKLSYFLKTWLHLVIINFLLTMFDFCDTLAPRWRVATEVSQSNFVRTPLRWRPQGWYCCVCRRVSSSFPYRCGAGTGCQWQTLADVPDDAYFLSDFGRSSGWRSPCI